MEQNRCGAVLSCNKKISLIDKTMGKCKCNILFCQMHRQAEKHACTYNYKDDNKAISRDYIAKNKCVHMKVPII